MTKHLHVRAPLIANPESFDQSKSVSSKSPGNPLFPFGHRLNVCCFAAQISAHAAVYVLLAQRVVLERHSGFSRIHLGREDIM
jgi:hypothetical protein